LKHLSEDETQEMREWAAEQATLRNLNKSPPHIYGALRLLAAARKGFRHVSFHAPVCSMRALCDLVAAKTGLPLYDLKKGQALSNGQQSKISNRI
jgi:hypothetical protein